MDKTDEQLISNYLSGDESAVAELVQRYLKLVFNFLLRFVGNNIAEAEDLTQVVFIKAWSNLKKFKPEKKFKIWLFSIAKNVAIDYLRKKKIYTVSKITDDSGDEQDIWEIIADPRPSAQQELEQQELVQELDLVIDRLAPDEKMILLFYYQEELNFREIAELLGQSIDTVKSRQRRALVKLRKILSQ